MSPFGRKADDVLEGAEGRSLTQLGPSTRQRKRGAFYETLVSDWSKFGHWAEAGAKTATERAHVIWKRRLAEFEPPPVDASVAEALDDFGAMRRAAGGASPMG
ncbi:MAG: trimethylamine methyltransferase family protein [Alphaproteobacteria bacterium]|nr:trimethylamine methyltransferase family protein [Alphaproteobacteria bacterium]